MGVISNRVKNMARSETLAMTKRCRELQMEGIDVINLSIGEPDFKTPDFIKLAAIQGIGKNFTHYPPVPGYLDLRKAIVHKLLRDNNIHYKPEQIVVSNGAKHSLINVLLATIDPGDEVIIPSPYWVSYPEMVKLAEGTPVYVQASLEQNFKVSAEQIRKAITPKTKMIIINSPSNPTGMIYTQQELKEIALMLNDFPTIIVLSDEIYELINFGEKHESIAQFDFIRDRVIVVNGVSKGFAMTGWRIGYMAAPAEIAEACNKIQGQMTSAASSIAQRAAILAMLDNPLESKDVQHMVATFKRRRNLIVKLFSEIDGFKVSMPDGAFYLFINISDFFGKKYQSYNIQSGSDFANFILDEAYVAMVGGDAFGDPNCIRISYAAKTASLKEAVRRIAAAVIKLQ